MAAGQRLQRGPDLQHFFFVFTSRPFAIVGDCITLVRVT